MFQLQDNIELLRQLQSGFKRKINSNKYQSKVSIERQKQYSEYLTDPTFQGVNRLFVLFFENKNDREARTGYFLQKVQVKG